MKRAISVFGLTAVAAVVLGGCPIYSDHHDHRVCDGNGCYDCPDSYMSNECLPWQCSQSNDCPSGYSCNQYDRCVYDGTTQPPQPVGTCTRPSDCGSGETCGSDNRCHTQDCSIVSCPSSYVCLLSSGVAKCVPRGTEPPVPDASPPPPTSACNADAECASSGAGSKCLDGTCVRPADQCTDTTQCGAGSQCVEGACTPSCSTSTPCPTGYQCDEARGVCSKNATPCTADTQCSNNTKCVSGHCVSKCTGTTCSGGLVCVNGGCVPEQRATFACNKDGAKREGERDTCQQGSICLRRSCYITCDADAGASDAGGACRSADAFNVCKTVSTSNGAFAVCSTQNGLGSECGPTLPACASSKICIDGICR